MAARTSNRRTATKSAQAKPKPAPEPVEEELEELEAESEDFEEIEEAEPETAPAKGAKTARRDDQVTYGVAHLAKYLSEQTGKEVTTRELRTLIRKMARDDSGRVNREIVAGNRSRYDWPLGLKDPEVKAIVKAYLGGEAEEAKKQALAALQERNAKKRAEAAKTAPAKPTAKKAAVKKVAEPVEEVDDEDDEELDFGDE
jgi:hypothetical protein